MKFTDGNWLVREGYEIHFPKLVYDVKKEDKAVTLYAPTKYINHRGDTLDGPLLTIKLTAPLEDVIRVETWHYQGEKLKYPNFDVANDNLPLEIDETDQQLTFNSGELNITIDKDHFRMLFENALGELTVLDQKGLAWIEAPEDQTYMRSQLKLSVGEHLYGLGERFTPFVKNGQSVEIWNEDGGTSSEQSYKNVPFYLSSKGYGVFINHPEKVSLELGSELVARSQFSVPGEKLDYYIINGPTPKEVIGRYTTLTGRPALPPAWSFGLWLSTSFTTNYNEETVNHFVDGMAERGIPLSVFHFDCFWMDAFEWTSFIWDRKNFPDPEGMLKRLKEKDLKISVWINPYIAQKSPLFAEAHEKGYLIKKPNGDTWQWDRWQAGMGIVDFTNPEAAKWYQDHLRDLMAMGVDSFKTDFGERIPTDVVYYDGSNPEKMHNYYSYLFNQVVFDVVEKVKGEREAVLFARSSTAGGQKFPVHWGGDCDSTYEAMAESLRGGLSLTTSGFGYWSHDIGGFENTATPDVFKRWTAFGLLSSHSRFHGSTSYRVPWEFDEEAVDVARHFTKLKNQLMPYIYRHAIKNHETGVPMMRPMIFDFPDDPLCETLDRQYMFGDALLVAPIFNEKGLGSFYLPVGKWTHLLTGEVVEGGIWIKENYDYFSLPLFVRENTVLPIGSSDLKPVYNYGDGVTLRLYQVEEGTKISTPIYSADAELIKTFEVTREAECLIIKVDQTDTSFNVELIGVTAVKDVTSGEIETTEIGTKVTVPSGVDTITITL
ncbi:alpha-xylosidase [Amphibacillus xylanus]|uniref:alpha-D-xyloside xylohydrolase n=1 Tax=Amphibacillus xylanus (strain ATCC 51415 / DSM 6626 / JCM 7361 / LMG 17667 / NBRC 15112 / Ep01) TaxID=698758 RepID=K0IWZ4_AMPXN|nr:alpha-xylosidase [Amphibacillus xylanus]BAM46909.1 alpha-xylosidase [Amphibacillus xylanus NBRC 15112]